MFSAIQKLRRKPKAVREKVALGVAGTVTAFVAVGWLAFEGLPFGSIDGEVTERESGAGAFSTILTGVREQTAALGNAFSTLQSQTEEVRTEVTESAQISIPEVGSGNISTTSTTTKNDARPVRIATTTNATNTTTTEGVQP